MRLADAVPYRLLEHVSSHGDPASGNLLIQGDNLETLKALLPLYRGQVKCIYIDPPYNTKSAFEHYDDNLEHSQWLSTMYPRLVLLRELLAKDGSIWVSIDDNEGHYLKVVLDEVFGRGNFVANVVWQSKDTPGNNATGIAETHNHLLVYQQSTAFKFNLLPRNEKQLANYSNPDDDSRGPWLGAPLTRVEFRERDYYPVKNKVGKDVWPPKGSSWRRPPPRMRQLAEEDRVWWGKNGDTEFPMEKKFLTEAKEGVVNRTWWPYEFAGSTRNASAELKALFEGDKGFDTPKPEKLIQRVLEVATGIDDLVLDSFLGSGTTSAVCHKMARRHIGIEMGDNATKFCLPRLEKVIVGEQGGISQVVGWKGGGGFKFVKLGEPIFDEHGAINPKVPFATLASFIWLQETGVPTEGKFESPLLGVHKRTAFFLLFNGILGDKRPNGGNVLTGAVLRTIGKRFSHDGPKVVYGEGCRLGSARLEASGVTFKHIPYDVRAK